MRRRYGGVGAGLRADGPFVAGRVPLRRASEPADDGYVDADVLSWLTGGDVAVVFAARRDLLGSEEPDLQERIAREGDGAALLAARGPGGHWGRGFYQPKWTSSHYTLLELMNLGLAPANPVAREGVALVLREKGADGGLNPSRTIRTSDACVNGMALGYASYFGAPPESLVSIVDFLLGQRVVDGGFNCRLNREGTRHSSVHTSVSVLEGITEYALGGYDYRLGELLDARASTVEFFLRHRLYRGERTGEPIDAEFTRLHHPARWHFDVLRGLDAMARAGVAHDPRMDDALGVIDARRRPDGRWVANRAYPGVTHLPPAQAGRPSRWITLIALRVLAAYRGAGTASGQGTR